MYFYIGGALCLWLALLGQAGAQRLPFDPTGRSGEPPRLIEPDLEQPKRIPGIILPPVPSLPKEKPGQPATKTFIREIHVTGNTVFSAADIAQITGRFQNRELTTEDLETLRVELTLLYVNKGYVNSGAILPDQTITEGIVEYRIIEGKLTGVELEGNRWFRDSYLTTRILSGAGTPFNVYSLQEQLRLLLEDQRIGRINAEIKPGLRLGEAALQLRLEERTPYKAWTEFNNYQSPSVGAERGIVAIEHQNLTGNGDIATAQYGRSQGQDPMLDFKYALPLNALDTSVSFQYQKNNFAVIQAPFEAIDVKSKSDIYTLTLRQPLYRTLNSNFAFELVGERLSYETYVLGERFTLSPGAHNGRSIVAALRPTLDFTYRDQSQVVAARSRFSFGLDALGATMNPHGIPDGKFFSWLGQFQWVRQLGILDSYAIFRTDLQLANNPLMSLEQIAIGGRYSVRGYTETSLLRDNAVITSLEGRLPLVRNTSWADYLELAPFIDYGRGWNTEVATVGQKYLFSIGVGLRWGLTIPTPIPIRPQFEIYVGHPIKSRPNLSADKNTLQDNGIHLQFVLGFF